MHIFYFFFPLLFPIFHISLTLKASNAKGISVRVEKALLHRGSCKARVQILIVGIERVH